MLRSNQEEQIKYFYLDRKFGSGSLREIGEALDEVHLCLPAMTNIDLINSLVMRMLDLIQTAKSFHIKHRVAVIFRHHSAMLQRIHSRDEIALVLSKCLKGSDEYTRIVAIQMIAALVSLFLKDIAVYHTLLSKIATITSKQEKKDSIICLTQILSKSTQISKLLTKNIA